MFPFIMKSGNQYGFCPGKATWDPVAVDRYNMLKLTCELHLLPRAGGLEDQENDFIQDLAWFAPAFSLMKFVTRADMILSTKAVKSTMANISNGRTK